MPSSVPKIVSLITVFAAFVAAQRDLQRIGPAPDVVYYNANVITVDDRFSYAQAIAISGDKFAESARTRRYAASPAPARGK